MPDRPAKPPHAPRLAPYLTVSDAAGSLAFYEKAFGFTPVPEMIMKGPDGGINHAEMRFAEASIMFAPEGAWGSDTKSPKSIGAPCPVGLYLYCDDVDALYAQATAAGAQSAQEPIDMFWGDRMATLIDPDGYSWSFATNVGDFDPSRIPAM